MGAALLAHRHLEWNHWTTSNWVVAWKQKADVCLDTALGMVIRLNANPFIMNNGENTDFPIESRTAASYDLLWPDLL